MCGIVGVIGTSDASLEAYQALLLMQHRGQDAAGILSLNTKANDYYLFKKQGLVDQVFNPKNLAKLTGEVALGHTRYSTIGLGRDEDLQPQALNYPYGIGLAHNGNIVNLDALKTELKEKKNRYIFSNNDGEILLNLIGEYLSDLNKSEFDVNDLFDAIEHLHENVRGGYAVVGTVAKHGLFAFRDPKGIRPLSFGENGQRQAFASESTALNYLDYKNVRDLTPGEMIFVSLDGSTYKRKSKLSSKENQRSCMFEYIYFANPEAHMDGQNVYETRLKLGTSLGRTVRELMESNVIRPDVVVPVPETSRVSALALSEKIGVPYRELLIKNRYVQRSFILNTQESRQKAVERKLMPIRHEMKGKKILLVDDSIVRGTTSKRLVKMLRDAGASEVYFASACPPILHPCYYGIDFPTKEELMAFDKTNSEIEQALGADKVIYLTVDQLKKTLAGPGLCLACVNGDYPVSIEGALSGKRFKDQK